MMSCSKTWSQHSTKTGGTKIGNPRPRFGVSGKKAVSERETVISE